MTYSPHALLCESLDDHCCTGMGDGTASWLVLLEAAMN